MSKGETIKGILRTFFWLAKEEWREMDHKFYKLLFGAIGFTLMALFWFYFLRNIMPMPFKF